MERMKFFATRLAHGSLPALIIALAGCASTMPPGASPPAGLINVASPAPVPAPLPVAPARSDLIDGNAWSASLATVTRALQQEALINGTVEVVRTADNRLRLRVDATDALDRRGTALQPSFRRFAEDMAEILARHPSVQVRIVGYSQTSLATDRREALGWARSSLSVLARRGVGSERLTARARSAGERELGNLALPPGRGIEFLLSDPG